MITTKALIGAATLGLATIVSSSAIAQSVVETDSAGLIGKRTIGVDLFLEDFRDLPDNGYGTTLSFNQPVSSVVDLSASLTFDSLDTRTTDWSSNSLEVGAVYYSAMEKYTPFVFAGLGYQWNDIDRPSPFVDDKDEDAFYRVGFGVEVPLAEKTSATGKLSYSNGVDSASEDSWGIELGLTHWCTSKFALKGSVTIIEDDAVVFTVGARFAF